eukprot:TRINITY_DN9731_c0_g1_i2.p1 TRINITY_DN9731_c0_g1~~TRINITY_DN9731_c0_g1_i2.p1  ORF type:complete len:454 (+),score=131.57 TRINITY_DN9731_c0_g1_i2:44-1405(+)
MGQCCVKDSTRDDDREFDDFREDGPGGKQQTAAAGKVQPKMSKYAADAIYPPTPEVEVTPPPTESSPVRLQGEYSGAEAAEQTPELSEAEKALREKLKKEEEAKIEKKAENKSPKVIPSSIPPKLSEDIAPVVEEKEMTPPPPPKRMTQKEMDQKEEDDRNAADRKRKEELIAAGEVQVAKKYEWNNDDLEVADDAIEITMDGEDIILEMADDDAAPISPPTKPTEDVNNYPNSEWFEKHNATPPSQVLFYHIRDTLTITVRPYIKNDTSLSFTPPSILHYKAGEHQVSLDLLHDGCKDPRLLSPAIPVSAATSDTELRKKVPEIVKELSEKLSLDPSYTIEIKQIMIMGMETCTCVMTFVGPVGELKELEKTQTLADSLLEIMKEGNEYSGVKMQLIANEMAPSISVRLTKPSSARWSNLIKPPPGAGNAVRLSPPLWLTPDDVDSSDDDDD